MLFEVTTEDIDNVLRNHFKFNSTKLQQEYIIMSVLDFVTFDNIVLSVDCLDEQTDLVYDELKYQIKKNIENIDFLKPLLIQKKVEAF